MAQIPSSVVSVVLGDVRRQTVEQASARAAQGRKDAHHAEEVAELEENAIGSVGEEESGGGGGGQQQPRKKRLDLQASGVVEPEEHPTLDLEA